MKFFLAILVTIVSFSMISFSHADEFNVQIDLHYENGDRVSPYESFFIIYPDHKEPFRIVPTDIPAKLALEEGHVYNAEFFVNDMFIEGFSIDLISQTSEKFEITVPTPSGLSFSVFYDDGRTLVEDATISVSSHTGFEWRNLKTAYDGKTYRTWVQSTTYDSDYYVATIQLTENIQYVVDEIRLAPGESKTMQITTPWPTQMDYVKIKVFDLDGKVLKKLKNYFVQLIQNDSIIEETRVPHHGIVHLDLLSLGEYELKLIEKISSDVEISWYSKKMILDGSVTLFNIEKNIAPLQSEACNCNGQ